MSKQVIDRLKHNLAVSTVSADNENYQVSLTIKDANEILALLQAMPKPTDELQTTIEMLMDAEEQTHIGINPNNVEHTRLPVQILCRILDEYDKQRQQIHRLTEQLTKAAAQNYCTICGRTLDGYVPQVTEPDLLRAEGTIGRIFDKQKAEAEPTEFTKAVRQTNQIEMIRHNRHLGSLADVSIRWVLEACDRIDRLTAENERLKNLVNDMNDNVSALYHKYVYLCHGKPRDGYEFLPGLLLRIEQVLNPEKGGN